MSFDALTPANILLINTFRENRLGRRTKEAEIPHAELILWSRKTKRKRQRRHWLFSFYLDFFLSNFVFRKSWPQKWSAAWDLTIEQAPLCFFRWRESWFSFIKEKNRTRSWIQMAIDHHSECLLLILMSSVGILSPWHTEDCLPHSCAQQWHRWDVCTRPKRDRTPKLKYSEHRNPLKRYCFNFAQETHISPPVPVNVNLHMLLDYICQRRRSQEWQ